MTDYNELVKALRCKRDDCEGCDLAFFDKDEGWMCQYAAKDDDAADAIEELQQIADHNEQTAKDYWKEACEYKSQLPKRGEWIKRADKHGMSQIIRIICSNCGKDIVISKENIPNYCPQCGANMEVQG